MKVEMTAVGLLGDRSLSPDTITIGEATLPTTEVITQAIDTRVLVAVDLDAFGAEYVGVPTDESLVVDIPDVPTFTGHVSGVQFEHGVVLHIEVEHLEVPGDMQVEGDQ